MKKILAIILIIIMGTLIVACSPLEEPIKEILYEEEIEIEEVEYMPEPEIEVENEPEIEEPLLIVTTIFPVYDWLKNVVGTSEQIEVAFITEGSPHIFVPNARQVELIDLSDLFVYIGGNSERWIEMVLFEELEINSISLMNKLDNYIILVHELIEESELCENQIHMKRDFCFCEYTEEYADFENCGLQPICCEFIIEDEHIWLSLNLASKAIEILLEQIIILDPENEEYYTNNATSYIEKLEILNERFLTLTEKTEDNEFMFVIADKFPLIYLFTDYKWDYIALFNTCGRFNNATQQMKDRIINFLNENEIKFVFVTDIVYENTLNEIVNFIGNEVEILTINTFRTSDECSFIEGMSNNLNTIEKAVLSLIAEKEEN